MQPFQALHRAEQAGKAASPLHVGLESLEGDIIISEMTRKWLSRMNACGLLRVLSCLALCSGLSLYTHFLGDVTQGFLF